MDVFFSLCVPHRKANCQVFDINYLEVTHMITWCKIILISIKFLDLSIIEKLVIDIIKILTWIIRIFSCPIAINFSCTCLSKR